MYLCMYLLLIASSTDVSVVRRWDKNRPLDVRIVVHKVWTRTGNYFVVVKIINTHGPAV